MYETQNMPGFTQCAWSDIFLGNFFDNRFTTVLLLLLPFYYNLRNNGRPYSQHG